ncbi:hypothetical protein [Laspinema olomoucense]|uniref:Uncharacterized protein n=1 Tax=Laspinema olomoucense D3b TaxID=2953688 RepID=A0ABT2N357_9CYAN|nr:MULTISPECIES: hypothetical protein [unclassified Laspinema]MCT7977123.1 hypothetical protein [Laspinema sp. D3b]MCT7993627.1 hypothetical protein [Laspinema sp. D3c]
MDTKSGGQSSVLRLALFIGALSVSLYPTGCSYTDKREPRGVLEEFWAIASWH